MSDETAEHLNEYIGKLKADLDAAERRAIRAEDEARNRRESMEDGRCSWAIPREWKEDGLPVPRLELHWEHTSADRWHSRCWYLLVMRHLVGHIVAHPLGATSSNGSREISFRSRDGLDRPFRDGAHANHDALKLGLPLCITTSSGDATIVEGNTKDDFGTQRWVRRAPHGDT